MADVASTHEEAEERAQVRHDVLESRSRNARSRRAQERFDLSLPDAAQSSAIAVEAEEREQLPGGGAVVRQCRLCQSAHVPEMRPKGEGISSEQLSLFLQALQEETNQALADASQKLSDQTQAPASAPSAQKPPRQPSVRRPPPEHARRIDNPIAVPAHERPCPVCGDERVCIGHDITEIIDLIPAEVLRYADRMPFDRFVVTVHAPEKARSFRSVKNS